MIGTVSPRDNTSPTQQGVAPIALTGYNKGEDVMLTVIYNETINSISESITLTLSSKLSPYFESPTYVDNGTGTNAIVFKVKAKKNITADDAQKINEYLVFIDNENKGAGFAGNIGTVSATVKDIKGN